MLAQQAQLERAYALYRAKEKAQALGRTPYEILVIASLIETCKLNGVDPQTYLADLLTRLVNGWPQSRIDELMPWHWPATT